MGKFLKYGLIFIGSVIGLIIIAAIAVPLFVDPNDYKGQIIEQVETKTGRTFQLEGDLKLSVFPWLGVEIGGMRFGNAAGFGDQPMVKTGLVQARVKLLPLLKKDIEMSTLVLKDASVLLMKDQSGKTNWDDLLALGEDQKEDTKTGGLVLASFALGGIQMENTDLVWDDQSDEKYYSIKGMNLKTGKLALNEPVDLEVAFDFDARAEKILGGLEMQSTIEYDLEKKRYRLTPFQFNADLEGAALPGGSADIRMTAKAIDADLTEATAAVEDLSFKAKDTKIDGNIRARNIFDPVPLADGKIRIQAAGLPEVLSALGQDPSSIPVKSLFADTTFSSGMDSITFQKLSAKAVLEGGKITNPVDIKLDAGGTYHTAGKDLELQQFTLEGPGATVQGSIRAKELTAKIPLVNGKIKLTADNVQALMKALGQDPAQIPLSKLAADADIKSTADTIKIEPFVARATLEGEQVPGKRADVNVSTHASLNTARETLNLSNVSLQGMGLDLQGAATGSQILSDPKMAGQMSIATFNLRQLMKAMMMEVPATADPKALTRVSLKTDFSGGKDALNMKNIRLILDDSSVKGNFDMVGFDNPATAFNLTIDGIDADRYLEPKKKGEKPKPITPGTAVASAAEQLPVDTMRKLKINGNLAIGKLTVAGAKLNNVQLGLNAKDGKINLSPAQAKLYKGSYSGKAQIDATGNQPTLYLTSSIKDMNAGPLLEDLNIQSNIEGIMNSDLTVRSAGTNTEAIKKNLSGDAKFTFTDGTLKGVNFGRLVREVDAAINGKKLPPDTEPLETDFSEMSGSFKIANGLISNQDLLMKSPLVRVEGKGKAHLVSEKIDYSVTASVVKSSKGQGGEELSKLEGIPIPIKVTGTFSKPKFAPDIAEVGKILAQKKLQKKLEKIMPKELKGITSLLGGKPKQPSSGEQASGKSDADDTKKEPADPKKAKPEDILKEQLKGILNF